MGVGPAAKPMKYRPPPCLPFSSIAFSVGCRRANNPTCPSGRPCSLAGALLSSRSKTVYPRPQQTSPVSKKEGLKQDTRPPSFEGERNNLLETLDFFWPGFMHMASPDAAALVRRRHAQSHITLGFPALILEHESCKHVACTPAAFQAWGS